MIAKFKAGTPVRWYAKAHKTEDESRGWVVEGLSQDEGLFPCYNVRNVVTGQRGDAAEPELVEIGVGLALGEGTAL